MAITGKELATASNVKAAFAKLLGDTKLAQRLRRNMGLGDTLGPLPVEFGGTGGTDRDALMRHLRMNNTSRGFFGATVKSIEKKITPPLNYGPALIDIDDTNAAAAKTDGGTVMPVVYAYSGSDVEKPVRIVMVSATRDGVITERETVVESLTTKVLRAAVYGIPKHDALGTVHWVFALQGNGGSVNGTQVTAWSPVFIEVSMTADGAVTAKHLATLGFALGGEIRRGNVFVADDGSMLLGTRGEKYAGASKYELVLVSFTPDRAATRVTESNLTGAPTGFFKETTSYSPVNVSKHGGLSLVQRYASGDESVVFDDALTVKSVPSDTLKGIQLVFSRYQKFPFGVSAAKADPTGLRRFELNERGEVVERLLSPIDGIREFPFGSSGYREGTPVEVGGETWVFGNNGGVCDQYGNYSEESNPLSQYYIADGDAIFRMRGINDSSGSDVVRLYTLTPKSAFFNEIGYRNA